MDEPISEVPTESADAEVRQHLIDRGVVTPGETVTEEGTPALLRKPSRKERAIARHTAELQARIDALEAERARPAPQAEAAPVEIGAGKPRRADYQTDEEFEQAYGDYVLRTKATADAQAAEQAYFEQNVRNYANAVQVAKQKYEDWDQVVAKEIYIGRDAQTAIIGLANPADVIYYLGCHEDLAAKLGRMRPVDAITAVGQLSQYLFDEARRGGDGGGVSGGGEEYRPPRPKPKLPAPVRTVNSGGAGPASSFKEIASRPDYTGKAADLKRALQRER